MIELNVKKQLNELKKAMHDMKHQFSRELEMIKRNQMEIVERKNSIEIFNRSEDKVDAVKIFIQGAGENIHPGIMTRTTQNKRQPADDHRASGRL